MKIGIIRETKVPVDKRTPLTPSDCAFIQNNFPHISIIVQPSTLRVFTDIQYQECGCQVQENLNQCNLLLGIKEVKPDALIPNKTYMFFSHTIKMQASNRTLLQTILDKKITLIDYELLVNENGQRIVGFGKFAGIVGAYNAILGYGLKTKSFSLPRAYALSNYNQLVTAIKQTPIPNLNIAITGNGKVAHGAMQLLKDAAIYEAIDLNELENTTRTQYFQLQNHQLFKNIGNQYFKDEYYTNPELYHSVFNQFFPFIDILINGIFWNNNGPKLFEISQVSNSDFKPIIISDISCDINGSCPLTTHATTIAQPFYDINKNTNNLEKSIMPFSKRNSITITTIDNLPNELPYDSSIGFSNDLLQNVLIPYFQKGEPTSTIINATITNKKGIKPVFQHLSKWLK